MAKLKDLLVRIGLDKTGLTKLNKQLRDTKYRFRANFGEIAGMAKNVALAITGTLVAGIGTLIKQGAKMETLRTGFISIAGGANKAAAIVKELNEFTATTPFKLEQVSRAARQLLAVGTKRSDLQKELRMLGDIAASSGSSIEDIAAIFSKVKAKGKVELENLNQLAERGVPIFDELRKVTGDANMEFGAGKVKVEDFNAALASMTEEGGLAAGAMENLSETVEGRISTLMDNLSLELGGFAERSGISDAFAGLLKETTEALQGVSGVTESDVAAALGEAEEAMEAFGNVSLENLDEVEGQMGAAQATLRKLIADMQDGVKGRTAIATLFGGQAGGREALLKQAQAVQQLSTVLDELGDASVELNTAVMEGTVAEQASTEATNESTEATKKQKKAKEQLIEMERSHLVELGKVKELQVALAEDVLAQSMSTKELKGSYEVLEPVLRQTSNAYQHVAGTVQNATRALFDNIKDSSKGFHLYLKAVIEDLLVKVAGLVATFAVLSLLMGGATGVAAATGGKAGLGHFLAGGLGITGFAQGGMVTGPTMALVGEGPGTSLSNPEVIAPLNKLQSMMGGGSVTVTGRLDGRDILISSERANFDRNRVRGF